MINKMQEQVLLSEAVLDTIAGGTILGTVIKVYQCPSDPSTRTSTDDVYVEGKIITAENYDSAY